jgi:NAD(P)-dependent dehydrogenase (short-subunit alcohol dehydrogenase family)
LSLASLLLSKGCNVVIADLVLRPEAKELVDKYSSKEDASKPRAVFQKTDVTDWKQLEAMFDRCNTEFGGVDIVGPGAGVFEEPWSNFWYPPGSKESRDAPDSGRYKMLDINLTHPIRVTQMAIAQFLNPKDGKKANPANPKRIVLTSSIAGQTFSLSVPLYHASKHAISGFTRCLEPLESTLGIRVNCVAPAVVKTPLFLEHPEKLKMVDQDAEVGWVLPEEVAEAMVKLMEDEELGAGTILEVGPKKHRVVPAFNNPGPTGEGISAAGAAEVVQEVFGLLSQEEWGQG